MKKLSVLVVLILGIGLFQCLASDDQVMVCITSEKEAPINGNRDIHVWVKNFSNSPLSATLRFFIDGKGTTTYNVQLNPHSELKKTRNESWSTARKRKIAAQLLISGGGEILVKGWIKIHITPAYQSELTVVCSNDKHYRESELPRPEASSPSLPLLVCVSTGKNPPVYGRRDIHAWVTNRGRTNIAGLKLYFSIKDRGTKIYDIPELAPGQTWKKTRSVKWSYTGNKEITAKVLFPDGMGSILVNGSYKVSHLGMPTSSEEQNVRCSDNTVKKESDLNKEPAPVLYSPEF